MAKVDLPGAVHLVLPEGLAYLDPDRAVFEGMLDGWWRQQRSRLSQEATIKPRLSLIRRFTAFTGLYPWQWTPAEVEAFTTSVVSGDKPLAYSTVRSYQITVRQFCDFITDRRYGWAEECLHRFGQAPMQICHEWNTVEHLTEYEGRPGRRALTYDEVQALFDAADRRAEEIRRRGRKGVLAARRDAAILKTVYAFGLRRSETAMLDVVDLRRNPRAERYGRFGCVQVRYGKASRGGPPKRRTVLTVPEMDWIVDVLAEWADELRPAFSPGAHPALFVTERRGRVSRPYLDVMFGRLAADACLPEEADLHSLRHSYVTHLLEFGYPPLMVQQQVGHAYASTTALYTNPRELHQAGRECAGHVVMAGSEWHSGPSTGGPLTWAASLVSRSDAGSARQTGQPAGGSLFKRTEEGKGRGGRGPTPPKAIQTVPISDSAIIGVG